MRFVEIVAKWLENTLYRHGLTYQLWLVCLFVSWMPMLSVANSVAPPWSLPTPSGNRSELHAAASKTAKEMEKKARTLGKGYTPELLAQDSIAILELRDRTGAEDVVRVLPALEDRVLENVEAKVFSRREVEKVGARYERTFKRLTNDTYDPLLETTGERRHRVKFIMVLSVLSMPFLFVGYVLRCAHRRELWTVLMTDRTRLIRAALTCPDAMIALEMPRSRHCHVEAEYRAKTGKYLGHLTDLEKSKISEMAEASHEEAVLWLESLEMVKDRLSFLPYRLRVVLAVLILLLVQLFVPLARLALRTETAALSSCVIVAVSCDQQIESGDCHRSDGDTEKEQSREMLAWITDIVGISAGQVSWTLTNAPPPKLSRRQRKVDHVPLFGWKVCSIAF